MPIYRGDGGSADSSTDAYASQIAQYAQTATEKATESENSATESANSASAAATSEANAAISEANAAISEANAENTYENFDARYLGSKASDPVVDNQGNPLITGAVYWNSNSAKLKVYDGSSWTIQSGTGTVTSVGGTGTVNGISLSGTVTSAGVDIGCYFLDLKRACLLLAQRNCRAIDAKLERITAQRRTQIFKLGTFDQTHDHQPLNRRILGLNR